MRASALPNKPLHLTAAGFSLSSVSSCAGMVVSRAAAGERQAVIRRGRARSDRWHSDPGSRRSSPHCRCRFPGIAKARVPVPTLGAGLFSRLRSCRIRCGEQGRPNLGSHLRRRHRTRGLDARLVCVLASGPRSPSRARTSHRAFCGDRGLRGRRARHNHRSSLRMGGDVSRLEPSGRIEEFRTKSSTRRAAADFLRNPRRSRARSASDPVAWLPLSRRSVRFAGPIQPAPSFACSVLCSHWGWPEARRSESPYNKLLQPARPSSASVVAGCSLAS